jgi:hypothetical protein
MYTARVFVVFLCEARLPALLIMHVPISELHAQWKLNVFVHQIDNVLQQDLKRTGQPQFLPLY